MKQNKLSAKKTERLVSRTELTATCKMFVVKRFGLGTRFWYPGF